jgi:hypothetical protein
MQAAVGFPIDRSHAPGVPLYFVHERTADALQDAALGLVSKAIGFEIRPQSRRRLAAYLVVKRWCFRAVLRRKCRSLRGLPPSFNSDTLLLADGLQHGWAGTMSVVVPHFDRSQSSEEP